MLSLFSPFLSPPTNIQPKKKKKKLLTLLQRPTAHNANTDACTHSAFSLLRNMRAGSNSQAGKAVVDSNLDLAGLGYFYFPKSHREKKWREVSVRGGGLKSFYKCQTMTGDQGLRRRTVINSPEKARGATQKRDSSVSSAQRKKGCQGNKGSEGGEEESGREGRKEGVKKRGGVSVCMGGGITQLFR